MSNKNSTEPPKLDDWLIQIKNKHMHCSTHEEKAAANIGMGIIIGLCQIADAIDRQTRVDMIALELNQKVVHQQGGLMKQVGDIIKEMGQSHDEGEEWKNGYSEDEEDADS